MKFLTTAQVIQIHEAVINPNELQGLAADKSIDSIIAQINNRLQFSLIDNVFELAACYAGYLAVGHVFNDANKRTAFAAMDTCLAVNGIEPGYDTIETGDTMIKVAQGLMDETALAGWLRTLNDKDS